MLFNQIPFKACLELQFPVTRCVPGSSFEEDLIRCLACNAELDSGQNFNLMLERGPAAFAGKSLMLCTIQYYTVCCHKLLY